MSDVGVVAPDAAFISSYAVQFPSLHMVYEPCKSSAHIILEEESGFAQYVD